jgi:hypothetical protein
MRHFEYPMNHFEYSMNHFEYSMTHFEYSMNRLQRRNAQHAAPQRWDDTHHVRFREKGVAGQCRTRTGYSGPVPYPRRSSCLSAPPSRASSRGERARAGVPPTPPEAPQRMVPRASGGRVRAQSTAATSRSQTRTTGASRA